MKNHELTRQEKGKLAELIVGGLHRDPEEQVVAVIKSHVQDEYGDLVGDGNVSIVATDISGYEWKDQLRVPFPATISWRPDIIFRARWRRFIPQSMLEEDSFWKQSPPFSLSSHIVRSPARKRREESLECIFGVYYPLEVKSGKKLTLTAQQSEALPQVDRDVEYVHPVMATIDISDLPGAYSLEVTMFDSSDWKDGDSRYPSTR